MLNGWIDFNADGDWDDSGERVVVDQVLENGANNLTVSTPTNATTGASYARFRLTGTPGYTHFGLAPDGEVEDYRVTIAASSSYGAASVSGGLFAPLMLHGLAGEPSPLVQLANSGRHFGAPRDSLVVSTLAAGFNATAPVAAPVATMVRRSDNGSRPLRESRFSLPEDRALRGADHEQPLVGSARLVTMQPRLVDQAFAHEQDLLHTELITGSFAVILATAPESLRVQEVEDGRG